MISATEIGKKTKTSLGDVVVFWTPCEISLDEQIVFGWKPWLCKLSTENSCTISDIFKPIWHNYSDISDRFKYLKLQLTSRLFSPANFRNDDSQKHKVNQGDESASFFLPRSCSQPHGKKLRHGHRPFCCINGGYNWHLVKTKLGWIARDWILLHGMAGEICS